MTAPLVLFSGFTFDKTPDDENFTLKIPCLQCGVLVYKATLPFVLLREEIGQKAGQEKLVQYLRENCQQFFTDGGKYWKPLCKLCQIADDVKNSMP